MTEVARSSPEEQDTDRVTRITVNLENRAADDLHELRSSTGESIKRIIAHALSIYRFLDHLAIEDGTNLIVRRKASDTPGNAYITTEELIRFL